MRRHYVASTSLRRHVPAGNLAPPPWPPQYSKSWPPNILNLPTPIYYKFSVLQKDKLAKLSQLWIRYATGITAGGGKLVGKRLTH